LGNKADLGTFANVNLAPRPYLVSAVIQPNGVECVLTFNEPLDNDGGYDSGEFDRWTLYRTDVGYVELPQDVWDGSMSGDTSITMMLPTFFFPPVDQDQQLFLKYRHNSRHPYENASEIPLESFFDFPVTNESTQNDTTQPVVSTGFTDGYQIFLQLSKHASPNSIPSSSSFILSGTNSIVTSVIIPDVDLFDTPFITLNVSPNIVAFEEIELDYTPIGDPIVDLNGNELDPISALSITNYSSIDPGYDYATTDGTRTTIKLHVNLNPSTGELLSQWEIEGSYLEESRRIQVPYSITVENSYIYLDVYTTSFLDETVTVRYTKGVDPLKDLDDNEIDSFELTVIANSSTVKKPSILIDMRRSDSFTTSDGYVDSFINLMTGQSYDELPSGWTRPIYDADEQCAIGNGSTAGIVGILENDIATLISTDDVSYEWTTVFDPVTPWANATIFEFFSSGSIYQRWNESISYFFYSHWQMNKQNDTTSRTAISNHQPYSTNAFQTLQWIGNGSTVTGYFNGYVDPLNSAMFVTDMSLNKISFFRGGRGAWPSQCKIQQ